MKGRHTEILFASQARLITPTIRILRSTGAHIRHFTFSSVEAQRRMKTDAHTHTHTIKHV